MREGKWSWTMGGGAKTKPRTPPDRYTGLPYDLLFRLQHVGQYKGAGDNYAWATGVNWDCPRHIRMLGRP